MANERNTQSGTSAKQAKDKEVLGSESKDLSSATQSTKETAKDTANELYSKAKDTAGKAYDNVSEKAADKIEEKKSNLTSGLSAVADSLKQAGSNLRETDEQNPITDLTAQYGDVLANQIEQVSRYFERKDIREILHDVESFARRNPAVFVGAAFGLGFLASRFLKSSPANLSASRSGRRSLTSNGSDSSRQSGEKTMRNLSSDTDSASDLTSGGRTQRPS